MGECISLCVEVKSLEGKQMLVEEAKKWIEYLQEYIRMIESYTPTMGEEAVYLYVQLESVTKVVQELNKKAIGSETGN